MRTLFIEAKVKNLKSSLGKGDLKGLPKKLIVCYSIQYKDTALLIKKQLVDNGIKVISFQQVLGCSRLNNKNNLPILLIGSGKFHSFNLYLQTSELYVFDVNENILIRISEQEIKRLKNKRRAALLKFLSSEKIGILVSTKPGQENLGIALKIKQKLENKGKKVYVFLSNNIDIGQFENFDIGSWVNTACPGLSLDNPNIINYSEIEKL